MIVTRNVPIFFYYVIVSIFKIAVEILDIMATKVKFVSNLIQYFNLTKA